jgi:uncharacterized protein
MKKLPKCRYLGAVLLVFMQLMISCRADSEKESRVLLITGGHNFDTTEFFEMFSTFKGVRTDTASQPNANRLIASGMADRYDIFVFYDYWQPVSQDEKDGYLELTRLGKGFLFLHHSIVSYQGWPEFSQLRGANYPKSNPPDTIHDGRYRHDIDLNVEVLDTSNAITKGMKNFTIHDEGYRNVVYREGIIPLLETHHPDCSEVFAWVNHYNNSAVITIMGGHDRKAYENEGYRQFIQNSLDYLGNKTRNGK